MKAFDIKITIPSLKSLSSFTIWFHNNVCDKDVAGSQADDDVNILLSICDESIKAAFHISN